jgi:hypothetical protein
VSTFDDLLSGRPAQVRATARAARSFIRSLGADVAEQVGQGEASYRRRRPFCQLAVGPGEVLIRFAAAPPDPHRLLRGAGSGASIRLRAPTDFSDDVRALIRTAYQQASS